MLGFNAQIGAIHTIIMTGIVYHAPAEKAREKEDKLPAYLTISIY